MKEINFDNSTNTWPLQEQGRKDAKNVLKLGEGVSFDLHRDYNENEDIKSNFATFSDYITSFIQ